MPASRSSCKPSNSPCAKSLPTPATSRPSWSIVRGKGNYGYNAATGEYGDMVEMGVLDPTKVTRTALQNAASVAGLMLTTDCMVAELAEDKPAGRWYGHGRHGRHGWYGMFKACR